MNETNKNKATLKDPSPLVQSVLVLDEHFNQLERLSEKIDEIKLKTDSDYEQARRLLAVFAEHGDAVSKEIMTLSQRLQDARVRAESAAALVAAKAEQLSSRQEEETKKMDAFRALAAKVQLLSQGLRDLRKPEGETVTEADRSVILAKMTELDLQLQPLIEEAQTIKDGAREAKMKSLEQQAESITQTLINAREKLAGSILASSQATGIH